MIQDHEPEDSTAHSGWGCPDLINKEDNPQWTDLIWAFSQLLPCLLGVSGLHNLKTTANQGSVYESLGIAG